MLLIAQNHLQFIIEVSIFMFAALVFCLNLFPLTLSFVNAISFGISIIFTLVFGLDILLLVVSSSQFEFTHPFGPLALMFIVICLASINTMRYSGVNVRRYRRSVLLLLVAITLFGGLMHRSFLLLWILGLFIAYILISKSFRRKTAITLKRVLIFCGAGVLGFGLLELISLITGMAIFSPSLRIGRIDQYSLSSIKMVLKNTLPIGHSGKVSFWGTEGVAFAEGYISLPMQLILFFGLPFPLFFGSLVNQKDTIDYMLPGIFGYTFDFGYIGLIGLMIFVIGTIIIGLKILFIYREKREKNIKRFYGREALLIGSLSAFIAQSLIGCFVFNRTINGMALLTFIFIGCSILAHTITIKRRI